MAMYILRKSVPKTAKCSVRVGSQRRLMTDLSVYLHAVTVDVCRDEPVMATLEFTQWVDQSIDKHKRDANSLQSGEPILIEVAFTNHTEEVMDGFIKNIVFDSNSDSQRSKRVTMVCQDKSFLLDTSSVQHKWGGDTPVNDHFIATAILNNYGMTLTPDSGMGRRYSNLEQDGTDYHFLQSRARANNYELLFYGDSVYFGPMRLKADCQYDIVVEKGLTSHCQYFSFQGTKALGDEDFYWACGELNGLNFGRVLKVGDSVCFDGIGEHHTGTYYVDKVCHHFMGENYYQRFKLLRPVEDVELSNVTVGPFPTVPSLIYDVL